MKANIVRIGNSQGIRIPKPVLEQVGFSGEVELEVEGNTLVIRNTRSRREGWNSLFLKMAKLEDDAEIIDVNMNNVWDEEEWEWQ